MRLPRKITCALSTNRLTVSFCSQAIYHSLLSSQNIMNIFSNELCWLPLSVEYFLSLMYCNNGINDLSSATLQLTHEVVGYQLSVSHCSRFTAVNIVFFLAYYCRILWIDWNVLLIRFKCSIIHHLPSSCQFETQNVKRIPRHLQEKSEHSKSIWIMWSTFHCCSEQKLYLTWDITPWERLQCYYINRKTYTGVKNHTGGS